ncbi:hypothetical protein KDH_11450 [Dictyobacter sp. S3.2.2.5]|uniref:Uncharacterized protein n=1 Tax=Dictyobacter halimunensis TaxID=3026934 RepID=A0ABQ6FJB2_9CHLR|nr:hypothetical protein KDH_11450 [Dictyobacter sp. S3.2.2.5]
MKRVFTMLLVLIIYYKLRLFIQKFRKLDKETRANNSTRGASEIEESSPCE